MLAFGLWRDRRCQRCGGDLTETTDDANSGDPDSTAHYVPHPPARCHRCTALSASEQRAKDNHHPQALIHRVELQPRRPRVPKPAP